VEFEDFMKRELYGKSGEAPLDDLSGILVDFSLRYDLNPEEIRSILRTRNVVVYDRNLSSPDEVRQALLKIRLVFEKLSPLWGNDQYDTADSVSMLLRRPEFDSLRLPEFGGSDLYVASHG
jgi:hypothetical protein